MRILFLDDDPVRTARFLEREPDATCVETAGECINQLHHYDWDQVFLDHDLGGEIYVESGREDCGMEVVRWLEQNHCDISRIIVHSYNHAAAEQMVERLKATGYARVHRIPFANLFNR
jgi:DNA-binding NarL/FixJ family response regulator